MPEIVEFFGVMAGVIGIPMVIIFMVPPLAKAFARRIEAGGTAGGEAAAELAAEVNALRSEVEELRTMAPRLLELEERVDFTERLLARGADAPLQQAFPEERS